jgi:hypothetical protein
MGVLAKARRTNRRTEAIWAAVICGGIGGCLALVALAPMPSGSPLPIPSVSPAHVSQPQRSNDDDIRTGSILITRRGDDCEHLLFDNDTGHIRLVGRVSCEAVLAKSKESKSGSDRVQTISNAFRHAR